MSNYIIPQTVCDAVNDIKDPAERMAIYGYIATQAARIAELEAAIHQYVNHVVSYEGTSFIDEMNEPPWAKLINDTWVKQAALAGGENE